MNLSFSRTTRKPLAAMLSMLTLFAVSPGVSAAAADGASGGTRYGHETSDGRHVLIAFARDGRGVTRALIGYVMKCTDGATFTDWAGFRDIPISRTGAFKASFDSGPMDNEARDKTIKATGSLKGRRTRTRVSGTYRFTIQIVTKATGETVTCDSGAVRYSAVD